MGLGDFFRRRRERESAIPPSASESAELGSFAASEDQPVVGQQIGGSMQWFSEMPAEVGDPPLEFDLRGSGLREEIVGIMKQHGIDPDSMSAQQIDASAMPALQQQIVEALGRYGIDAGGSGSSAPFGTPDELR